MEPLFFYRIKNLTAQKLEEILSSFLRENVPWT
jgi:hypothetical protein